jgi:hypothetical protein
MITNTTIGRYGRLGNQLYQYASAFSLAKKLNTELWIPEESEINIQIGRYNPVINDYDKYSNDLFRLFDLKFGVKKPTHEIENKILFNYVENPVVKYYPEFWDNKDNTNLHGYFQAKQYVDEYEKDLRVELTIRDNYFDYGLKTLENLKKNYENVVSVHIRRGDLTMDNHAYNANLCINNYYKKIISENTNNNDIILIFSDDTEWCKNVFDSPNIIFIDNRKKNYAHLYDFTLMSMCDVNVMAVSTFSWWASWLNPLHKNKKVFMPKKWWGWSLQSNCEEIYRYEKWIEYNNE